MLGFDSLESFMSCYYTTVFSGKTTVKAAQEAGRTKGLPYILGELQTNVDSWSAWESSGYKSAVIHASAQLLTKEFDRLTKKNYSCEQDLQQNLTRSVQAGGQGKPAVDHLYTAAGELKKTLQDEVGIIHGFLLSPHLGSYSC